MDAVVDADAGICAEMQGDAVIDAVTDLGPEPQTIITKWNGKTTNKWEVGRPPPGMQRTQTQRLLFPGVERRQPEEDSRPPSAMLCNTQ